jgi:Cu(I)/Ag(I) efflux system membrane fusion protein
MATEDKHYDLYKDEPLPEGEEAPPPLIHTMSIVRWCILIGLSLFALVMVLNFLGLAPWEAKGAETALYHCPMHPTYTSNQPGECPICGMTLVLVSDTGKTTAVVDSSTESALPPSQTTKAIQYTCPMHPEVISDKPGKCPKCGMNLIPIKDTSMNMPPPENNNQQMAGHDMSNMGSSPVPGLVPVTIEPERLQLIGIRTANVEMRSIGGGVTIPGIVTPDEGRIKNLHVRINGWVQKLFANQTGQYIEKGQPLMSI